MNNNAQSWEDTLARLDQAIDQLQEIATEIELPQYEDGFLCHEELRDIYEEIEAE